MTCAHLPCMATRQEMVPQHLLDLRRYFWDPDSVCRLCGEPIGEEDFYVHGRLCPACHEMGQSPIQGCKGGDQGENVEEQVQEA